MLDVSAGELSSLSKEELRDSPIFGQGLPQHVHIVFDRVVVPKSIALTFQGGFVGTRCAISVISLANEDATSGLKHLTTIYPEDVNRRQIFELPETGRVQEIKFIFEESSDFFGRITIYDLQIMGLPASAEDNE